jgi:hypothetical protein
MKNMRAFLMSFLVVVCACISSGCATTSHDSYTDINDSSGFEKKQPSPTEDMTTTEKIAALPLWILLEFAYGLGQSGYSFKP